MVVNSEVDFLTLSLPPGTDGYLNASPPYIYLKDLFKHFDNSVVYAFKTNKYFYKQVVLQAVKK